MREKEPMTERTADNCHLISCYVEALGLTNGEAIQAMMLFVANVIATCPPEQTVQVIEEIAQIAKNCIATGAAINKLSHSGAKA